MAAGSSQRYGKPKLLQEVAAVPIFIHTIACFVDFTFDKIVLVVDPHKKSVFENQLARFTLSQNKEKEGFPAKIDKTSTNHFNSKAKWFASHRKNFSIILGGETRALSSFALAKYLQTWQHPKHSTLLIHDAARPLLNKQDLQKIYNTWQQPDHKKLKGLIPARPPYRHCQSNCLSLQ